jgi:hypothetical protein
LRIQRQLDKGVSYFLNTFDIKWNMAIIFIDKKNIEIKKIPIKEGLELNISL